MTSTLTTEDYNSFWVYLYFGTNQPDISHCIERAYLDFCRTLTGIGRFDITAKAQMNSQARDLLTSRLLGLSHPVDQPSTQEEFDQWHRDLCEALCDVYQTKGYTHFRTGQAQKWINMTFKYIFALGEERITGFGMYYALCHVPIDNIMLAALNKYNAPKLSSAWSRIDDYAIYLRFQQWIRDTFLESPLDVEFKLWLGQEAKTRY